VRKRAWRAAATLIVIARQSHKAPQVQTKINSSHAISSNIDADYLLLMLQRHSRSSFMPSAYVFPGGVIDKADYSEQWMQIYKGFGYTERELSSFSNIAGPRPELFEDYSGIAISPEVAFRICAIREAFEECGLMLFRSIFDKNVVLRMSYEEVSAWRQKVHENASAFLEFCRKHKLFPDIWSLREWSNWLTPSSFGSKRFDTMFYICAMDCLPYIKHDEKEMSHAVWSTPKQLVTDHIHGNVRLAPPQLYEMSRLLRFQKFEEISKFSVSREVKGSKRLLPVRIKLSDGIVSLLPGDDKYEPIIELANTREKDESSLYEVEDNQVNLEEFRQDVKNFNRIEIVSRRKFRILCNQELCGHYCSNFTNEDYVEKIVHLPNL